MEPDLFDLNDWVLLNHSALYKATRYLSSTSDQYKIWYDLWCRLGKPDLSSDKSPWDTLTPGKGEEADDNF